MRRVVELMFCGLAGCATPPATETVATSGCAVDIVSRPFVGGWLGLVLDPQIAEENTRRRQEARAHEPADCPKEAAPASAPAPTYAAPSDIWSMSNAQANQQNAFCSMVNAQANQQNAQVNQQNAFWNMVGASQP